MAVYDEEKGRMITSLQRKTQSSGGIRGEREQRGM
jgi:hypothetical protein